MSELRSDINQLLIQIKYNFQVLWRFVDYTEDSNVGIVYFVNFKQTRSEQICRRWLSQQSSLLLGKSPVFFWCPLILKYNISGVNVTWRCICARNLLISSESSFQLLISSDSDVKLLISSQWCWSPQSLISNCWYPQRLISTDLYLRW